MKISNSPFENEFRVVVTRPPQPSQIRTFQKNNRSQKSLQKKKYVYYFHMISMQSHFL
jgi:hypothetical protein